MTKKYFVQIFTSLFVCIAGAQEMKLVSGNPSAMVIKHTSPDYVSAKKSVNNILYENFEQLKTVLMMEKDAPSLPMLSESLILPATGAASITISYDSYVEFDNINVLPSKGSLKRNVNPATIQYTFGPSYSQNAFYPGQLAKAGTPYVFRNTRGITVTFYPYQYNPVTHQLRVYKNISVTVSTNNSVAGINERQDNTIETSAVFQQFQRNHYLNATAYVPVLDEGEMLIIAPPAYADVIKPFVNWKNEKGMKTTAVSLSTIGATPAAIKAYILDAYQTNTNLVYVQLIGDHENLPCYSYGMPGSEELWSDSYYGQLAGTDMYPELLVGRFSGNVPEVQTMISRVIEYETNPLDGNWMTNAIGIGSNEGYDFGDDGQADWQHLHAIGDKLTEYGYENIYEFYDGSQGFNDATNDPSSAMISTAINSGAGLMNYTGHGWTEGVSTGNYTVENVNALSNTGKYPFVISVACNNGTFVGATSLCESFTRASQNNLPTGAIASCGSSILMAWAEPMQTQDEMTELIVRSNELNIKTTLGGLFYNGQLSMLEEYNQSGTAQEVMQTWVFFGDPSTVFRNKTTADITAEHVPTIPAAGGNFTVASNTEDALVSITQENEILATGYISAGSCTLTLPEFISMGDLNVTLTKQNTRPYRGHVIISTLGISDFSSQFAVFPNPASEQLHILNTGNNIDNASVQIMDINGRMLWSDEKIIIAGDYLIPVSSLSTGIYVLKISSEGKNHVQKIIVE